MKVLHINSYCSDSKFYKLLFEEMAKRNIDLKIYIPVSNTTNISNMDFGKDAIITNVFSQLDRLTFIKKHMKILKDIEQKVDCASIDIIHAHSLFSNGYIAYMLNKKYGIPYIVAVRDTDINLFFGKIFFLRNLGIEILENASKIIYISPQYKENGLNHYIKEYRNSEIYKKSVVIPNGIDQFWIENMYKRSTNIDVKKINVLSVARVSKRKNLNTLAKACSVLINEGYDLKLTIIGKIEDKNEYKKLMKNEFVNYCKPVPKEKLINYYRENDIFALLSNTETFGLVYLEAISQGLPVLFTKGQGFDGQITDNRCGRAINNKDVNDIARGIKYCVQNYKNIANLNENNLKRFSWKNIVDEYLEIYSSING